MLYARDVIRSDGDEPRNHRVVWADQREVWLFDLDQPRTVITRVDRAGLEARLGAREAVIVTAHGYDVRRLDSALTDTQKRRREEMLAVISPIVAQAPEIFDNRLRGRVIADLEREKVRSAKTLHAALDSWWRGGMTSDTLVPAFDKVGRSPRADGARKAGRKQPAGTPQGLPITPEIEKIFKDAIKRFYSNDRRNALTAAYHMMLGMWFVDELRDAATGAVTYRTKPEYAQTGFPTMRQFRYWYGKQPDRLGTRRKRMGSANYDKDSRTTTGSARDALFGVGSRFEIDATKLEQSIVSEVHPGTFLDPPTFYQVTDVYSSLVCGIYVGYEESSWIGAGLAVRNVVEDKVEFARRFGVAITADQWPCQGVLPKRLLADNAEFKGDLATEFTAKSQVKVENARPLMGPDKGTVEGKFNLFKTELRKLLPGLVRRNQANPYDADHRADAAMTLKQLTAAVIEAVVLLNARKLVDFERRREMIEAGVFAVPKDMWAWAVRTGTSELRRFDVASAEFAMLPTAKVSVTKDGARFKKLFYVGDDPRADAFVFARQDGVTQFDISYDPLCTTNIYVHDPKAETGYRLFKLTGGSREYRDISFEDASKLMAANDAHTKKTQFEAAEANARFTRSHAAIASAARKANPGKLSPAEIAKGKKNAKTEREVERAARESALPRTQGVGPVIDRAALFAARQERNGANRDILGERAMAEWLRGGDGNETA